MIENENKPENVLPSENDMGQVSPENTGGINEVSAAEAEFVKPETDNEDIAENVSSEESADEEEKTDAETFEAPEISAENSENKDEAAGTLNASESMSNKSEESKSNDESAAEEEQTVEIVGIRFKKSGKIYYFDPDGTQCERGGHAIVETARGVEYGTIVIANRHVSIKEIVLPLRKLLRVATAEDEAHHTENLAAEKEAFRVCLDKIHEHNMSMKLIDVEYTFDNNKLLFYFTADGRVDFRDLVKDLAAVFRTRIELRQIGIRDEAKLMGGLGVCGRTFCCHSFLGDFAQVSIKMAKEQNLSLNSAKISGACGRLMCCLRYENDVYEEEAKKLPRLDAIVQTPDGDGVVIEVNALAGKVRVKLNVRPEVPPKYFTRDEIIRVKGYIHTQHDDDDDEELRSLADEPDASGSDEKRGHQEDRHRPQRQPRGERPQFERKPRDFHRRNDERPSEEPVPETDETVTETTESAEAAPQKHERPNGKRDRNDRRRFEKPQRPRREHQVSDGEEQSAVTEHHPASAEQMKAEQAGFNDASGENTDTEFVTEEFESDELQPQGEKRHRPQRPRHRSPRNGHIRPPRPRRQNGSENGGDN